MYGDIYSADTIHFLFIHYSFILIIIFTWSIQLLFSNFVQIYMNFKTKPLSPHDKTSVWGSSGRGQIMTCNGFTWAWGSALFWTVLNYTHFCFLNIIICRELIKDLIRSSEYNSASYLGNWSGWELYLDSDEMVKLLCSLTAGVR